MTTDNVITILMTRDVVHSTSKEGGQGDKVIELIINAFFVTLHYSCFAAFFQPLHVWPLINI